MSWLPQGLQDIGLGGLNTFFNSAIKPALENPIVDIGLGLGAAGPTGGLLAPELGGLFGAARCLAGCTTGLLLLVRGDLRSNRRGRQKGG